MKNINIQIPPSGKSLRLALRQGACSGQVIVVASDEVEIHVAEEASVEDVHADDRPTQSRAVKASRAKVPADDLDAILKRLLKLKPTKRIAAVNSIKAMFQFNAPISDEAAEGILEKLRRRGCLHIDEQDKIRFAAHARS